MNVNVEETNKIIIEICKQHNIKFIDIALEGEPYIKANGRENYLNKSYIIGGMK